MTTSTTFMVERRTKRSEWNSWKGSDYDTLQEARDVAAERKRQWGVDGWEYRVVETTTTKTSVKYHYPQTINWTIEWIEKE